MRELRQNASKYLDRVKRGESIEVTERGVPIAVLGPVPEEKVSVVDRLIAEGRMTPAKHNLMEWLETNPPVQADPDYDGPTTAQILDELREDKI